MGETGLLHFAEHRLQEIALFFMAVVYILKVVWILRFKPMRERTPARGSHTAGIAYSYATLVMPWAMESSAKHPLRYAEFALFHLAVAAAIALSFFIPYGPQLIAGAAMQTVIKVVIGLGFIAGVIRLVRRLTVATMRVISSPDDLFSITLLNVFLALAFFSVPNDKPGVLVVFFIVTAFFLVYVPFSKISHYLLWPFTRYYLGWHWGHRGVYPKVN